MTKSELLELLKKARKQLKKYHVPIHEQTVTLSIDTLENAFAEQSEVVRCRDCHYGIRNSKEDIFCIKAIYNDKYKRPDWFCADGERRKTEGRSVK